MKAIDAYRDILKELDKAESPSFSIRDFNYFFNNSISQYITQNYKVFDIMSKEVDDLRSIIVIEHPLTLSIAGLVTLPEEYRHMLNLKVKVKFKQDIGRYKKNEFAEFYPERMKSGQKGFRNKNAYGKPSYKRYYYEISGSNLQLLFDSSKVEIIATAPNLWMDFIKQPSDVYLNPDKSSDYNDIENNSVLFFATGNGRNHVYYEIIRKCKAVFLENIESPRAPVAAQQAMEQ